MSHAIGKRPVMSSAHAVGCVRLLAAGALLLLSGCATGPYNPQGQAAGVAMMQSGLQMMQPQQPQQPVYHQSACHWFGGQWVCSGW